MSDLITVQGAVLSAMPVGEYDRRIVLLTRERGKISCFAKGARRQNSPFMAATSPFVFGNFTLYEGRSSYNLNQAEIQHHFVELAAKQPGIYYGYYFLELADYFGREGTDEREMLNLLFLSVKALLNDRLDDRLVRSAFELRAMAIQGLMPQLFECVDGGESPEENEPVYFSQEGHGICCSRCFRRFPDARRISPAALYSMRFIVATPLQKLYTFTVGEEVLGELSKIVQDYVRINTDRRFNSLEILKMMA